MSDGAREYDGRPFWGKVRRVALRAGKHVIREALVLYYCLKDPGTPGRAKAIIVGALGYFILPFDFIPDLIPFAGFTDDMAVLVVVTTTLLSSVKPEHRSQAKELLEWEWQKQKTRATGANGGGPGQRNAGGPVTEAHCKSVLGLEGEITPTSLRERYRELARKYHPDKVQHLGVEFQEMAEQKLKEFNEAYEYLKRKHM